MVNTRISTMSMTKSRSAALGARVKKKQRAKIVLCVEENYE